MSINSLLNFAEIMKFGNSGGASDAPGRIGEPAANSPNSANAVAQDARTFEQLMEQAKDGQPEGGIDVSPRHDRRNSQLSLQDAPERSMGVLPMHNGLHSQPDFKISSAVASVSASVLSSIDNIRRIDQLVDLIAASVPTDSTPKVILKLSADVLPETVVSLEVVGSTLEVAFNCGPEGLPLPSGLSLQQLAERLAACANGLDVRIIAPAAPGFEPVPILAPAKTRHPSKRDEKEGRKN